MSGFKNDVVFAKNADFSKSNNLSPSEANGLATNGQLWIGSTALNVGGTHVNVGNLTSTGATITITNGAGTINLEATGGVGFTNINVDANTPPGTDPVLPSGAGTVTITGAQVAAGVIGANVIRTDSLAANTFTIEIQRSAAVGASASLNNGVSHFNSAQFTVDANGFVSASGAVPIQFTADSGTAVPVAGNINIFGGPGVTTSATGSTVIVNSVVFTDTAAATLLVDNGYFATASGTYPLPATATQGELIHVVCDTAGAVVLDAPALNFIRIGSLITSSGGTATSTSIGDSLTLRYRLSSLTWEATSVIGTWVVA